MPRTGRRGGGAGRRSTHAKPPHDNPLLRQQDHMLARLTGAEEDKTAGLEANRSMTTAAALSAFAAPRARTRRRTARAAPHAAAVAAAVDGAQKRLDALRTCRAMPHPGTRGMAMPAAVVLGSNNWVQLGPTAIPGGQTSSGTRVMVTGRITAICIDPANPQTIYAGAARGGIWKSMDGGRSWAAKSDNEVSLATGALAVARSNPQVLYAGTGEGNLERYVQAFPLDSSPDNYLGSGVLKSTNGGDSWVQQGAAALTGAGFFRIVVHPTNPDVAYAATSKGLFRTTDGGANWNLLSNGLPAISGNVIAACDVAIDPSNPDNVYCAFFGSGIYKSANAGAANPAWSKQAGGLPGSGLGRIAVAISPSAPSVVYAALGNTSEGIRNIYRTTDGGGTWAALGVDLSGVTGSSSYTLDIAVDPTTPDIVYVAGTSLYKATRNTATGAWSLSEIGADIHPDMHYLAFDPADHLVVYAGTDGGIYRSSDGGASWSDTINQGLCITQFQVVDHHPSSPAFVIGGTQDNGTEQYRNSPVFYHSDDGDGGFVAVDPTHPRTLFHTYYSVSLARSTQTGNYGSWFDVTPGLQGNSLFYAPFALDAANPRNIAYGTDRICLDDAQGTNEWATNVTLPGVTGRVSSICYVNSTLIYAGTSTGKVYKLTLAGANWTAAAIDAAPLPARWIWDVLTVPGDPNTIVVVMSGFGTGHVWRGAVPAAGAATWTDISGAAPSRLPDIPVNSLAIEPAAPATMYAGTDIGVFRTTDGGASWSQFSQGLPNCAVYDLKLHNPSRLLRAGTHGRGLWERKLDAAAVPDVNVFLRDNLMESGRDAASSTGTTAAFDDPLQYVAAGGALYWFMCADIKVDALEGNPPAYQAAASEVDYVTFERKLQHRNPRRGNVNRIYVQLHNRGVRLANGVTVKLLAANAAAGLPPLPADFWNVFPADSADTSAWVPVGPPQVIPALSPTQPAVLEWDWSTPMSAADHSCLLVVCDCPDDPIPAASRGLDVATLVRGERHAGLKNVHVVSALPGSAYWTPFAFFGRADQPQLLRIAPAQGAKGWGVGLLLAKGKQKNLKLTGVTKSAPNAQMQQALKARLGSDTSRFDTASLYMVDNLQKGGILEGVALTAGPRGGELQAMLLLVPPQTGKAGGTVLLLQEEQGIVAGGSAFVLQVAK